MLINKSGRLDGPGLLMISNQICENSCDKSHFIKAAPDYNTTL